MREDRACWGKVIPGQTYVKAFIFEVMSGLRQDPFGVFAMIYSSRDVFRDCRDYRDCPDRRDRRVRCDCRVRTGYELRFHTPPLSQTLTLP